MAANSASTILTSKKMSACNTRMNYAGTTGRLRLVELDYTLLTTASSAVQAVLAKKFV
jgi:hypothetical protein